MEKNTQGAEAPAAHYPPAWFVFHSGFVSSGPHSEATAKRICAQRSRKDLEWEVVEYLPVPAAAPRPQEPRCPECGVIGKLELYRGMRLYLGCHACAKKIYVESIADFAQFFLPALSRRAWPCPQCLQMFNDKCSHVYHTEQPPAQSQGAAPLCGKCGAILTPTGLTRPGQPRFQCLSCGATTSCTEGDAKNAKS